LCGIGEKSKQGSASCQKCLPGEAGTPCVKCSTGQYRGEEDSSDRCIVCPSGYTIDSNGSAVCQTCELGKYGSAKEGVCSECLHGFYQDYRGKEECVKCKVGLNFFDENKQRVVGRTAPCEKCSTGRFGTAAGDCEICTQGKYSDSLGSFECLTCNAGKVANDQNIACQDCAAGLYGSTTAACIQCVGNSVSKIPGESSCTNCTDGYIANDENTACIKPEWNVPQDCDFTTQYLNDSSINQIHHECASCPLGASCEGNIGWSGVKAKYGWWRIHQDQTFLPSCLSESKNLKKAEPTCAFEACLYPHACHGSKNPHQYMDIAGNDPALTDLNETCDWSAGYKNNTCGLHYNESCRLCATCRIGYKRIGAGTKCKLCPPADTNRVLLGIGFTVMIFGSAVLIYMTIQEEGGVDEASDAIKKIILNYLQIVSLAGGLPLQWPEVIDVMFDFMSTVSSAGGTLLIPDCELTHMRTSDAFYIKQIFFTFVVPLIVVTCVLAWSMIWCMCRRCCCHTCPQKFSNVKNYMVLSIVLILFLCYPMLVKICLSMLKCPLVGDQRYLMADLHERCFIGRHAQHVFLLTLPQFIGVVLGLPIMGLILIKRSNKRERLTLNFRLRYGLLYLGYRDTRAWWEVIIAMRKICIVAIGTFGILMGRVDIQAFLALGIVFLSIVIHLLGKPFDTEEEKGNLLHYLEFLALCVAWSTFYGGLMFYLLPGDEYAATRVLMTCIIVSMNLLFVLISVYKFVVEF
jgi:hypothetical protein